MKSRLRRFALSALTLLAFVGFQFTPLTAKSAETSFRIEAKTNAVHINTGQPMTLTTKITNTGPDVFNSIIDFEIYDMNNNKVFQTYFPSENFPSGNTKEYEFEWKPEHEGIYVFKVGVFSENWRQLLFWNNAAIPTLSFGAVADGTVYLSRATVNVEPYYLGEQSFATAYLRTDTPPSHMVLVDLELYNSNNEKVAQQVFENVQITSLDELSKRLDFPRNLPEGRYFFKVGIFKPNWQGLITWYNDAATVDLARSGQIEDLNVIMTTSTINPQMINEGESSNLAAAFISPSTTNHVLIDLELYNANGEKVAQSFFNNLAFPRAGTGNFQDVYVLQTLTNLPAGTYTFKVGIFRPDWAGLINWYNNAGTLTVVADPMLNETLIENPAEDMRFPSHSIETIAETTEEIESEEVNGIYENETSNTNLIDPEENQTSSEQMHEVETMEEMMTSTTE